MFLVFSKSTGPAREDIPDLKYAMGCISIFTCASVILLLEFPPQPSRSAAKLFFSTGITRFILGYEPALVLHAIGVH